MSPFGLWTLVFLGLCVAGAAAAVFVPSRHVPRALGWLGAGAGLVLLGLGLASVGAAQPHRGALWTVPDMGVLRLEADPLAGVFLAVSGLVFFTGSIFASGALSRPGERHCVRGFGVLYFGLLLSVAWVLTAADVFSFFVAWEVMSILLYLLVTYEHEEEANRRAGYLMLAVSEAGALAAVAGLLLLAAHAGSLDFAQIRAGAPGLTPGVRIAAFLLVFYGFGVKAGLVPVSVWLPGAYAAAPRAFGPVLAGATLNLGLYGIIRSGVDLSPPVTFTPGLVALVTGSVTALVGILYATTEDDLKKLLAHSSIENAGIVMAAFGAGLAFTAAGAPALGAVGLLVALYHMVNHSLYKTLLFIGSGEVETRAGSRALDQLGGLIRLMPWTSAAMLVGVLSIAALPPFNGFISEWLTLQTLLRSAELAPVGVKVVFALSGAALALTAALAVTCFAKVFAMGFLGVTRSQRARRARDADATGLAPMAILAVASVLLGVLPTWTIGFLDHAVRPVAGASAAEELVPPFFAGSPGHDALPPAFAGEFHDLGAQVGEGVLPGPGLVVLHRGGEANPVVFAASPSYMIVVLAGLLGLVFVVVYLATRRRTLARGEVWAGGILRLLPEMTYTATGFANPVRVIFQAIFRPTVVADTRETVAEHFRTAIRREEATPYIADRMVLVPTRRASFALARALARMHHGRLNAYLAYVLVALLAALAAFGMLLR
jgi:hydrogenase-4 component B